jgi:hypothetical protein
MSALRSRNDRLRGEPTRRWRIDSGCAKILHMNMRDQGRLTRAAAE